MKKVLIWGSIVVVAVILGIGAAVLFRPAYAPTGMMGTQNWRGPVNSRSGYSGGYGSGMMGAGGPGGMMGSWNAAPSSSERITLDQAAEAAQAAYGSASLAIAEVMEFESNFYVLFIESDSGRGAFEVLVDPYIGRVTPEPGPNMMWNLKYGHMGSYAADNTVSLEDARQLAQQALDTDISGAELEGMGVSFYGYYTFDYAVDGQPAGMMSVNGLDGQVFYHTWHGTFIQEKEFEDE